MIADYVASDEWRGKAGAYAIQGIAAAFVRSVRGSVTNIIGLPLVEVLEALRAARCAECAARERHRVVTIAERWERVRSKVAVACERAGRASHEVTIVAVSKTHPASAVREAMAAGASDFGENYAQELAGKLGERRGRDSAGTSSVGCRATRPSWSPARSCSSTRSRPRARRRARQARGRGPADPARRQSGGEATKGGVTTVAAAAIARTLVATPNVRLDGLMTMPPPSEDPEASRPMFDELRALRDRLRDELGQPLPVLSMGMSGDFEVAIACGATHVRIGTAIFGSRPPA